MTTLSLGSHQEKNPHQLTDIADCVYLANLVGHAILSDVLVKNLALEDEGWLLSRSSKESRSGLWFLLCIAMKGGGVE